MNVTQNRSLSDKLFTKIKFQNTDETKNLRNIQSYGLWVLPQGFDVLMYASIYRNCMPNRPSLATLISLTMAAVPSTLVSQIPCQSDILRVGSLSAHLNH